MKNRWWSMSEKNDAMGYSVDQQPSMASTSRGKCRTTTHANIEDIVILLYMKITIKVVKERPSFLS